MNSPQQSRPAEASSDIVRIQAFGVPRETKGAWIWALKSQQGMDMDGFLKSAGDEALRKVVSDLTRTGKKVPVWIATYIDSLPRGVK